MIAFFVFANFIFLIYWLELRRRTAARIRRNKEARKLFWKISSSSSSQPWNFYPRP